MSLAIDDDLNDAHSSRQLLYHFVRTVIPELPVMRQRIAGMVGFYLRQSQRKTSCFAEPQSATKTKTIRCHVAVACLGEKLRPVEEVAANSIVKLAMGRRGLE